MKPTPIPIQTICCIGAGYVGGPTMAVIADRCSEIQVTVVDLNAERIAAWNDLDLSHLPVYEPGLDVVVGRARGRNLHFSAAVEEAIAAADMVFISVNTPTKTKGLGAGQASDLKWVEASARTVGRAARGHTNVVEKSTLPVRNAEVNQEKLVPQEGGKYFARRANPEIQAKGSVMKDLKAPNPAPIGCHNRQPSGSYQIPKTSEYRPRESLPGFYKDTDLTLSAPIPSWKSRSSQATGSISCKPRRKSMCENTLKASAAINASIARMLYRGGTREQADTRGSPNTP